MELPYYESHTDQIVFFSNKMSFIICLRIGQKKIKIVENPVKNIPFRKRKRMRPKKIKSLFLRKGNVPEKLICIQKCNRQEHIPKNGIRSSAFDFGTNYYFSGTLSCIKRSTYFL